MNFSELKVGDRIRQRSWRDSWRFWDFKESPEEVMETLTGYVGCSGFGEVESTVVKIERDVTETTDYRTYVYDYLVTIDPPLTEMIFPSRKWTSRDTTSRRISEIASCPDCEGNEEELGGCANPCWNCLLEKVQPTPELNEFIQQLEDTAAYLKGIDDQGSFDRVLGRLQEQTASWSVILDRDGGL